MYIDMHCHSTSSDDSRATVEQYLKWINALRNKGLQVDGICLTEHRKFDKDADYSELSQKYGVVVLRASELDTRYGHFLVYGVNDHLLRAFDFKDVRMDALSLIKEARASGAYAVPAHPGRVGIGLVEWMAQGVTFDSISVVERLNAGNRPNEVERTETLIKDKGYKGTGGSDAHFVSNIAKCMTRFPDGIKNEHDLVEALIAGEIEPIRLEETQK